MEGEVVCRKNCRARKKRCRCGDSKNQEISTKITSTPRRSRRERQEFNPNFEFGDQHKLRKPRGNGFRLKRFDVRTRRFGLRIKYKDDSDNFLTHS